MRKNAFPDQLEPSEHWRFQRKQEEFLASEFEVGSPKEWPGEHFNLHQDAISQYSDMPKTLKYLTTFRSKETSNNAQVDVVECSSGIYALKRIKRINSGKNNEELEQMNYIKGEVSILRKIHRVNYRHFVKLVASYTDEKYVGILMSPVADCNLATFLDNFHNNGYLNPHLLEGFFGCLASALAYLHYVENIRHKDIKPENILVMGNSVLLTDFGISLDWSASGHTTTSQEKMKTAKYCAPELDKGEPRNSKSDIWSLGCVFLEMFTVLKGRDRNYVDTTLKKNGEPPKFCRSPEIIKDLIAGLKAHNPQCENKPLGWIEKMLQQSHKERPNARILREEILEDRYCGICCQGDKVFQDVSPHQGPPGSDLSNVEVLRGFGSKPRWREVKVTHIASLSKCWISPDLLVGSALAFHDNATTESITLNGKKFESGKHVEITCKVGNAKEMLVERFCLPAEPTQFEMLVTTHTFDKMKQLDTTN